MSAPLIKQVYTKNLESARKKFLDLSNAVARRKIKAVFEAFLEELMKTAPVRTGQFLGSFRVGTSKTQPHWEMSREEMRERNPYLRGSKVDYAKLERNRQDAINMLAENYDPRIFNVSFTDPKAPKTFYMVNSAPHAKDMEFGGPLDWTLGAHVGVVNRAKAIALEQMKK